MDKILRNLDCAEITLVNTLRTMNSEDEEKIVIETIAYNLKASISRIRKKIRKESKGEVKKG